MDTLDYTTKMDDELVMMISRPLTTIVLPTIDISFSGDMDAFGISEFAVIRYYDMVILVACVDGWYDWVAFYQPDLYNMRNVNENFEYFIDVDEVTAKLKELM